MSAGQLPRLFDLNAVADTLRVSPHTVRKWVKEGRLQPIRLCRRLLFHPEDVAALVARAQEAKVAGQEKNG